ncbi:MAG: hypothetical protein P8Y18_08075 [Candidatus Bathyarchaeota archaeon]
MVNKAYEIEKDIDFIGKGKVAVGYGSIVSGYVYSVPVGFG